MRTVTAVLVAAFLLAVAASAVPAPAAEAEPTLLARARGASSRSRPTPTSPPTTCSASRRLQGLRVTGKPRVGGRLAHQASSNADSHGRLRRVKSFIRRVIVFFRRSMRTRLRLRSLPTQSPPAPIAIVAGARTRIVATTLRRRESNLLIVPSPRFATQTPWLVAAIAIGSRPTLIEAPRRLPVFDRNALTLPLHTSVTHTTVASTATAPEQAREIAGPTKPVVRSSSRLRVRGPRSRRPGGASMTHTPFRPPTRPTARPKGFIIPTTWFAPGSTLTMASLISSRNHTPRRPTTTCVGSRLAKPKRRCTSPLDVSIRNIVPLLAVAQIDPYPDATANANDPARHVKPASMPADG